MSGQVKGSLLAADAGNGMFQSQDGVVSLAKTYKSYLAGTVNKCNELVTRKAKELWELFKKQLAMEFKVVDLYNDFHRTCRCGQILVREAFLALVKECGVVVYSKPMDSLICRIIGKSCCAIVVVVVIFFQCTSTILYDSHGYWFR